MVDVPEEVLRAALADAGIGTFRQFTTRYRQEILEMLECLPRPKTDSRLRMAHRERQKEHDRTREAAVTRMWHRYRKVVAERAARMHVRRSVSLDALEWPPEVLACIAASGTARVATSALSQKESGVMAAFNGALELMLRQYQGEVSAS
jgi:hypothetical protein